MLDFSHKQIPLTLSYLTPPDDVAPLASPLTDNTANTVTRLAESDRQDLGGVTPAVDTIVASPLIAETVSQGPEVSENDQCDEGM